MQEQTCLKTLWLRFNKLSSETTGQLFSALLQSGSLKTIEELKLCGSTDFSSDVTCATFSDLIDRADGLRECDIGRQVGERKIKVELMVSTVEIEGISGSIKITDINTKQLILNIETKRTKKVRIL